MESGIGVGIRPIPPGPAHTDERGEEADAVLETIEELRAGRRTGRRPASPPERRVGLAPISVALPDLLRAQIEDARAKILAEHPDRAWSHSALALYRNPDRPVPEATSVGAWPTGMTPTTRPSCGSIWTTVPSALLAANTAPSFAHRPMSLPPPGSSESLFPCPG